MQGLYLALEGKANVTDVNKALLEVCSELEGKACAAEVAKLGNEQALVNSGFAQNLHLARCVCVQLHTVLWHGKG